MYAFNLAEYAKWREISSPAYRFWTRAWVDSLHMGTRVHWALAPVSVLSLAFLWEFMSRQAPRYTDRQRVAIKAMARRRHAPTFYFGSMPRFEDDDSLWTKFFSGQMQTRNDIRHQIVDWHLVHLREADDFSAIHAAMVSLFSCLVIEGFTTDHLFRAICKGTLDPQNLRATSVDYNLQYVFESYRDPKPAEYIAYTQLVPIAPGPFSKTLRRKWSNQKLHNLDEVVNTRTEAVLIGGELDPFIVTRRAVVSGIGELHRREAQNVYALRLQRHPELSVFVMPARSNFRLAAPGSPEKYYDVSFRRTELDITERGDDSGAILFEKATRDLFDAPEEAIRNLMVAAELRWRRPTRRETDEVLANAYRWSLRTRLSQDFSSYLARVRGLGKDPSVPAGSVLRGLGAWDWEMEKDFTRLLDALSRLSEPDDHLVLYRLREITYWYSDVDRGRNEMFGLANTWREIDDLLAVIRGIRNSATHFERADDELYGLMLYFAKVLFEAFTAAWVRDSLKTKESPAAAVTDGPQSPITPVEVDVSTESDE